MKMVYYVYLPKLGQTMEMTVNIDNFWEKVADASECLLILQELEKEDKEVILVKMAVMENNVNDVADKFWQTIQYLDFLEEMARIVNDGLNILLSQNLGKTLTGKF